MGIERDAKFVKPAELENEINSADILPSDYNVDPGAEGEDQGVGNEEDYNYYNENDSLGPESKPVTDDENKNKPPVKKDSTVKSPAKKEEGDLKPIGSPVEQQKKKKGLLNRIFGKKEN